MLAKPVTLGSLSWEIRYSVLAKLMSCCEVDSCLERCWEEAREKQNTQVPKFYSFSEVQWKQSWFYGVGGNQINSRHALAMSQCQWSLFSCPCVPSWSYTERKEGNERKERKCFFFFWAHLISSHCFSEKVKIIAWGCFLSSVGIPDEVSNSVW